MNKKEIIEFVPIDSKLYISLENANKSIDIMQKRIEKQKEVISKAIECIEKDYYSKNTVDIDNIGITTNKLLQVRNILKEVSE